MKKPKMAGRITDRGRIDFLGSSGAMLDASCVSFGVMVCLEVHGRVHRTKTIRQAIDAAIREGRKGG